MYLLSMQKQTETLHAVCESTVTRGKIVPAISRPSMLLPAWWAEPTAVAAPPASLLPDEQSSAARGLRERKRKVKAHNAMRERSSMPPPPAAPPAGSFNTPTFSWRQRQRWETAACISLFVKFIFVQLEASEARCPPWSPQRTDCRALSHCHSARRRWGSPHRRPAAWAARSSCQPARPPPWRQGPSATLRRRRNRKESDRMFN